MLSNTIWTFLNHSNGERKAVSVCLNLKKDGRVLRFRVKFSKKKKWLEAY